MLELIMYGFSEVFTLLSLLFISIGVLVGIIFGAIPGLSTDLCVILLLPITFSMSPLHGILILLGVYCGGMFGGSISAILIGTPGTSVAVATVFDGYPLTKQGKSKKALSIALVSSTIGGVISALLLLLVAPIISKAATAFGPPEYFALAIFGISIIAGISGGSLLKGLVMGCFGYIISMVGIDAASGASRFTFNSIYLLKGIGMLPVLLGTFAIPNILNQFRTKGYNVENEAIKITSSADDKLTRTEIGGCMPTILKSTAIGSFIGAIPGAGAGIAAFISYNEAKRTSKHAKDFGKGALDGIAASEASNNAVSGCSLIPLFTLGVPGSVVAALLVGAFTMHGLVPGPTLFKNQAPLMYAIMIGMLVCNIVMYFEGKYLLRFFYNLTKLPAKMVLIGLSIFCVAGAFSFSNQLLNINVLIIFGIILYILGKLSFPAAPFVLGIILGPLAEINLKNSLVMSDGAWTIFLQRPICLGILVFTIAFTSFSIYKTRSIKKASAKVTGQDVETALED